MLVAGKFAWVPHVKLPVKCLWYSGKFACARRQFACVLREVLAASKQVNLSVFTGKLHVTQVNCARDLFTCALQVKLPAFAGNFTRASFIVYVESSCVSCFPFQNVIGGSWILYYNPLKMKMNHYFQWKNIGVPWSSNGDNRRWWRQ